MFLKVLFTLGCPIHIVTSLVYFGYLFSSRYARNTGLLFFRLVLAENQPCFLHIGLLMKMCCSDHSVFSGPDCNRMQRKMMQCAKHINIWHHFMRLVVLFVVF